jgi:hypothetical protein
LGRSVEVWYGRRELFRVQRLLAKKNDKDILSLPRITNWQKIRIQQLLVHVVVLLVQRDDENESLFTALSVVEQSMFEVLSAFSAVGFADYAVAEVALGKKERAYTSKGILR